MVPAKRPVIPEHGNPSNFKRAVLAQEVDVDHIIDLVRRHQESTGFCSLAGHMRCCSDTYDEIIRYGLPALRGIFQHMYNLRREGKYAGMSVMLLVADISQARPYKPQREGGFEKYTVFDASEAWLNWGYEHGYLDKNLCPPIKTKPLNYRRPLTTPAPKRWLSALAFWRRK